LDYSLRSACIKYFSQDPFFLKAGVKTGLQIKTRNPHEVGADRIANAVGAEQLYPGKNLLIVDLGTATTIDAINDKRDYLGGAIAPGLRISMEALEKRTAKLTSTEIIKKPKALGRTSAESIQAGLYYGQLGMIRELCKSITREHFSQNKPIVIGTGGFVHLFEHEKIFDAIKPDLVLEGLMHTLELNL
ncbi:type III pantothenate kinase, partial [Myxococcota bacterium]|nr:type III pantothenate kinase [Myxococcota bacterium]